MTTNEPLAGLAELTAQDKRRFTVEKIEGIGNVRIQSIFEGERQEIAATVKGESARERDRGGREMDCQIICWAVVDANGDRILSEAHVPALMARDAGVISRLSAAIQRHWGLNETIADAKKNSSETPTGDSPSS